MPPKAVKHTKITTLKTFGVNLRNEPKFFRIVVIKLHDLQSGGRLFNYFLFANNDVCRII
jgi:hypothetical protein